MTAGAGQPTDAPPGGDRNPTRRQVRLGLGALALAGLVVAGYLTLYQVGVFDHVWEPFFGSGSRRVLDLTSPVPDAAFGVVAYAAELALTFVGGDQRWRTEPWSALAYGAVVSAGAVTSVGLMIVQPLAAGTWCTLCLVSAFLSLTLFARGVDEALAALQHVVAVRARGGSLRAAVLGGAAGRPGPAAAAR